MTTCGPKNHWRTQAQTQLDQSRRNDVSLSSIRKIRANHLGCNLHPGAEAQLIDHAVQMSQQRLILQLQCPRPQFGPFHLLFQCVDVDLLSIESTKELILFLINVCIPHTVAVCHGFGICLNLGQVFLHLALFPLQSISLQIPKRSAQEQERRMETYPSPLPSQKTPKPADQNC